MSQLYYVMGASGAGKDSVMNFARSILNGKYPVIFAHRYITRLPDFKSENHIYLTQEEFSARIKANLMAMYWHSHHHNYGIGAEIDLWLAKGFTVVINGSREYLKEALEKYTSLIPVLIETSPDVLAQRLRQRGRESEAEILQRLNRTRQISFEHNELIKIKNDGALEEAGMELVRIIIAN